MDASTIPIDELLLDQLDVITARIYGETGYPHEAWARMRREDPVHWCEPPGYEPFWAVTKHADITRVSKQPDVFQSAGRFILFPRPIVPADEDLVANPPLRMLVNMDPPEHRGYRKLVSPGSRREWWSASRCGSRRSRRTSSTISRESGRSTSSPTSPPCSRCG